MSRSIPTTATDRIYWQGSPGREKRGGAGAAGGVQLPVAATGAQATHRSDCASMPSTYCPRYWLM